MSGDDGGARSRLGARSERRGEAQREIKSLEASLSRQRRERVQLEASLESVKQQNELHFELDNLRAQVLQTEQLSRQLGRVHAQARLRERQTMQLTAVHSRSSRVMPSRLPHLSALATVPQIEPASIDQLVGWSSSSPRTLRSGRVLPNLSPVRMTKPTLVSSRVIMGL